MCQGNRNLGSLVSHQSSRHWSEDQHQHSGIIPSGFLCSLSYLILLVSRVWCELKTAGEQMQVKCIAPCLPLNCHIAFKDCFLFLKEKRIEIQIFMVMHTHLLLQKQEEEDRLSCCKERDDIFCQGTKSRVVMVSAVCFTECCRGFIKATHLPLCFALMSLLLPRCNNPSGCCEKAVKCISCGKT